jgi:translation initiation factor IF-3
VKGPIIEKALRLNERIRISPIRLIDQNNEQRGVMPTAEALAMARELGLDLVEVSPLDQPPVCRIMDYGKHKYTVKKRQKQQTSHEVQTKEVRLRPKTDEHDRDIKLKRAEKFLEQGHKVQITMLFRGRERQHRDMAMEIFNKIAESFADRSKIERFPRYDGRRMTMVLAPGKTQTSKSSK